MFVLLFKDSIGDVGFAADERCLFVVLGLNGALIKTSVEDDDTPGGKDSEWGSLAIKIPELFVVSITKTNTKETFIKNYSI